MTKNYLKANDLATQNDVLASLIKTANLIRKAQIALEKHTQATLHKQFKVAHAHNGMITVLCDNASIATKLRFMSADLISKLQSEPGLSKTYNIQCKVRKHATQKHSANKKKSTTRVAISSSSKTVINKLAEKIKDKDLANALKKMTK